MNPTEAKELYEAAHAPQIDDIGSPQPEPRQTTRTKRLVQYQDELESLRNGATMAAASLSDPKLLRDTLERLNEILSREYTDALSIATKYGMACEAIRGFREAVAQIARVEELKRTIDGLRQ